MQEQDSISIVDIIGGITPADYVFIGAGLGGLLMWCYWRFHKQIDSSPYVEIDPAKRRISLGLIATTVTGAIAGSYVGMWAQGKGLDAPSAAMVAFLTGLVAPWLAFMVVNKSYDGATRIARSKFFTPVGVSYQPRLALPAPGKTTALSPVDHTIMTLAGTDQSPQTVAEDWNMGRHLLLSKILEIYKEQQDQARSQDGLCEPISKGQLAELHHMIPLAPDFTALQHDTALLQQRRQELTIGEKTDMMTVIYALRQQTKDQQAAIDRRDAILRRHEMRYEPTSRLTREIGFGIAGFIARHALGLIL